MSQTVAQGTIYLGVAQFLFIISGYSIHIGLGRILGPSLYGVYTVIVVLITVTVNNFLAYGIPQATSKYISEDASRAESVKRVAFEVQFLLSLIAFLTYFSLADFTASLLNDPELSKYIRISSVMIIPFAMLAVIASGYFNGLREYSKQSLAWIASYISKTILIFGFVLAGYSVLGAVLGFALAPFIGLIIALYFAGLPKKVEQFSRKKILLFALPVTLQIVLSQYITNIDILTLKALTKSPEEVGYYSAASMISKVPVSLLAALNMALFPVISATTYQNDVLKTRRYVSESLRYLLLLLIPATMMLSLTSDSVVTLLYSNNYLPAGRPLSVLIVGVFFFTLFAYFLNIIIAAGKPKVSMILSGMTLLLAFMLNLTLIPLFDMMGAAFATTISCLVGASVSALYTYRLFGILMYRLTVLRIIISTIAVLPILTLKVTGLLLLIQYAVSFLIYLLLLKLVGELKEGMFILR